MKRSSIEVEKQVFGNGCVTITYGEQVENHVGMQKIGEMGDSGISVEQLKAAKILFEEKGCVCELIDLNEALPNGSDGDEAAVLIVRSGADVLLKEKANEKENEKEKEKDETIWDCQAMLAEQLALNWDTQAKMYGRVVKKNARYNLCYAVEGQDPDYENGKGTVVAFSRVPCTDFIRKAMEQYFKGVENIGNLKAEGNLYFDVKKCGIGFHGDAERLIVIAVRLGESIPLHYQWFQETKPIGKRVILVLNHGDIYIMSEKATGNDWKKKKTLTLRHAAGSEKFTTIDVKKKESKKGTMSVKKAKNTNARK